MLTQDDIVLGLERICSAVSGLSGLATAIEDFRTDPMNDFTDEITDDEQTALLKKYTGEVVRLHIDLAAYPMGYTTEIVFDEDGNLIG